MRATALQAAFFSCVGLGTADVWVLNAHVLPQVWALAAADSGELLRGHLTSALPPARAAIVLAADTEAGRTLPVMPHETSMPEEDGAEPHPDLTLEFETSARRLDERAKQILAERVDILRNAQKVVVSGHADATGPTELNEILSRERALSVARALRNAGVPRRLILVEWWGARRPRVSGNNKRVEIYLGDTP